MPPGEATSKERRRCSGPELGPALPSFAGCREAWSARRSSWIGGLSLTEEGRASQALAPVLRIAHPIREFLATEAASGGVLLLAAAVALFWANSPWSDSYHHLWEMEVALDLGPVSERGTLHHWVNEGLMTLFFFVVGLEIKRELVTGELADRRRAALPVIAALGGMVVPALVFLAFTAGTPGMAGWGIPVATDIAFAVGLLALLGPRVPHSLKIFLLAVAVADDVGGIVVIAVFYSSGVSWANLAIAASLVALLVLSPRLLPPLPGRAGMALYAVGGVAVWGAMLHSGVHATMAGVAVALATPARASLGDARGEEDGEEETVSVAERLENVLHPWSSFLVLPIFALANAGVDVGDVSLPDLVASGVTLGVALGLVAGKVIGIGGSSWLACHTGVASLPEGTGWRHMVAVGAIAGIGFTVSLFITDLAFDDELLIDQAKLGVLLGSASAALVGAISMLWACRREAPASAEGR